MAMLCIFGQVYFTDPVSPLQILQLALTQQSQKYNCKVTLRSYPSTLPFRVLKVVSEEKLLAG